MRLLRTPLVVTVAFHAACSQAVTSPQAGNTNFPVANPGAVTPVQLPSEGPWYHTVRTASSSDGLAFTDDRTEELVEHASVPSAVRMPDGTLRVYFVDFSSGSPERLGCVDSHDNGKTYVWGGCDISGLTSVKAVDPCPVLLSDGRVRLFFYASSNDVNSTGAHAVDRAISTDGVHFVREGTAFVSDGLVDPDVFFTGAEWVMHVYSLAEGATIVATSVDGLTFARRGILTPRNYGVTQPVRLASGTFRMYAFHQPDATEFVSLSSTDGLNWTLDAGTRFTVPSAYQITDPFVIARGDGTWLMAYKRQKRP